MAMQQLARLSRAAAHKVMVAAKDWPQKAMASGPTIGIDRRKVRASE